MVAPTTLSIDLTWEHTLTHEQTVMLHTRVHLELPMAIHVMDLTFIVNTIALNITMRCTMDHDWWQKHTTRTHDYMTMAFTWIDGNNGLGIVELILSCLNMRTRRWMLPHAVGCRNNNWWVWEIKITNKSVYYRTQQSRRQWGISTTGTKDWGWQTTNYAVCPHNAGNVKTIPQKSRGQLSKVTWHQIWEVMYVGDDTIK